MFSQLRHTPAVRSVVLYVARFLNTFSKLILSMCFLNMEVISGRLFLNIRKKEYRETLDGGKNRTRNMSDVPWKFTGFVVFSSLVQPFQGK